MAKLVSGLQRNRRSDNPGPWNVVLEGRPSLREVLWMSPGQ